MVNINFYFLIRKDSPGESGLFQVLCSPWDCLFFFEVFISSAWKLLFISSSPDENRTDKFPEQCWKSGFHFSEMSMYAKTGFHLMFFPRKIRCGSLLPADSSLQVHSKWYPPVLLFRISKEQILNCMYNTPHWLFWNNETSLMRYMLRPTAPSCQLAQDCLRISA